MKPMKETANLYDNPYYYEVAFSFRDIAKEVDFFEKCIGKFSDISVKQMLEIGCGPSPYMLELAKRGYAFTGLDRSKAMLEYSRKEAKKGGVSIGLIRADMRSFKTVEEFDFVFCMLGSIDVKSNRDLFSHLDSVAGCLRRGGLYLIDAVVRFDWSRTPSQAWTVIKDDLVVNVEYEETAASYADQTFVERIRVEVIEAGQTRTFKVEESGKAVFPQEFLQIVRENRRFEFVGWYNNFDLTEPLEKAGKLNRPMTILKRK